MEKLLTVSVAAYNGAATLQKALSSCLVADESLQALLDVIIIDDGSTDGTAALAVYFRDMMHLYSILTMGWMYATPLFYPITALPETLQKLMKLNPLYHYINLFRNLMMYGNIPGPNTWIACIFCAVASMVIGLLVFRKLQKNFILYI